MSNNIIDTVTQAVNSLVSALKLPDESAKANDTLGSMNFPQFSRILPYKDYDSATGLFINNKTVGFMFEARPLPGADKSIVATLEHLLRSKLPRGVPVSFHLVSSKLVGNDIDYGLREFRWSGKQAKKFNAITRAYYLRAAETQFPLPDNLDLPLTLRNYRVYISCCVPRKKNSTTQIVELENQIKVLRASLGGAYIPTRNGSCESLMKNTACTLSSRQCAFSSEEGTCLHEYATYSCETRTSGKQMICGGDVFCLDGECDKATSGKSNDFGQAVSELTGGRIWADPAPVAPVPQAGADITRGIPGIFCLPLPSRARSCGGSASRPGFTPSRRLDCWSPGYPCQPAATAWPEWACSPPAGCFVAHSMHRNGWDTGCCGPSWCC